VPLLLLLAGVVCAQDGFIPEKARRAREDKLTELANQLLKTKDTHERVLIRTEMVSLDVLQDKSGFSANAFDMIYKKGLPAQAGEAGDVNARLQAVIGLGATDSVESREKLITMFSDPSEGVRLRLLKVIHDRAIIGAWEQVLPMLKDPSIEIKIWAARTLGKLKQGAEGPTLEPLVALLLKSWRQLRDLDVAQTEQRADLNTLIEVVGRSLEQLTGVAWTPGPETTQIPDAIEPYTRLWNQRADHAPNLKEPRIGGRKAALTAIEWTADRTVAADLVDFMVRERQRWLDAPEADKRQHLSLLLTANDMFIRMTGMDSPLTTTSGPAEVDAAVKRWTDWWAKEVAAMGKKP